MTPAAVILTVAVYIAVLFVVAYLSGRKADNAGFFTGNRRTPWYMAALAMIGAAISGVTFISVPGSVAADSFSYMQMVLGFTVGQMVVAFVLIPLFYKMKVVSLYEYLDDRFGVGSHRTGGLVLLHLQIARRRTARLCRLRRHAAARLRPLRTAVLGQHGRHDVLRLALYAAGRRQVADLDRHAQNGLPGRKRRALHRIHRAGTGIDVPCGARSRAAKPLLAGFLLRRSPFGALFLEDVLGRRLHAHRHDGARPGHDAAQSELRLAARFAEKHRADGTQSDGGHLPLPDAGRLPLPLYGCQCPFDARKERPGLLARRRRRRSAGGRRHPVRRGTDFEHLFGGGFGAHGAHHLLYGRYLGGYAPLRRTPADPRPPAGARGHGRAHGVVDPLFRGLRQRQRHQPRLQGGELHLWPDSGNVRLRHVHPLSGARPLGTVRGRCGAAAERIAAICGPRVVELPYRFRIVDLQRPVHHAGHVAAGS